jgi:hypothetical protein
MQGPVYYNDIVNGKFLTVDHNEHCAETTAYREFAQGRECSSMTSRSYQGTNILVESHVCTMWNAAMAQRELVILPHPIGPKVKFADKPNDMSIECNLSIISLFVCVGPCSGSMVQPSVNSRKVDPSKMTDPASGLGKTIFEELVGFDAGGNVISCVPYELQLVEPPIASDDGQDFFGIDDNYATIVKSVSQLRGWSQNQYENHVGSSDVDVDQELHYVYNESFLSGVKAITPTSECCQRTMALFGFKTDGDFGNERFGDLLAELAVFQLVTNEDVENVVKQFHFPLCLDMDLDVSINRLVVGRYIQVRTKGSVCFTYGHDQSCLTKFDLFYVVLCCCIGLFYLVWCFVVRCVQSR